LKRDEAIMLYKKSRKDVEGAECCKREKESRALHIQKR
jgi:hypothetical protein